MGNQKKLVNSVSSKPSPRIPIKTEATHTFAADVKHVKKAPPAPKRFTNRAMGTR